MSPTDVTKRLGLYPTHSRFNGQVVRAGRKLRAQTRVQQFGFWRICTENVLDSSSLERHLLYVLETIEPSAEIIRSARDAGEWTARLFVFWERTSDHAEAKVSQETRRRISELDLELEIDYYGPYPD